VIPSFSFLIALGALLVSIKSYRLVQKHQILSVKPFLRIRQEFTLRNDDGCGILLKNSGLGPAIIKKFRVIWGDYEIKNMNDYVKIPQTEFIHGFAGDYFNTDAIIEKESMKWIFQIPIIQFKSSDDVANKRYLEGVKSEIAKNLSIEIEYTSLYEDKKFHLNYKMYL